MQNYRTPSNVPKEKAKLISQQTDKISQQPENWENRNGPDLVQAFPKKWWVKSDITAPNLPIPLRLKGSGCHIVETKIGKIVRYAIRSVVPDITS